MAFLFLMAVSAGLALGGVVAVWLGFDDRSPAVITAGAVAIASAAIVVAIGLLLRELRRSSLMVAAALGDRPGVPASESSAMRAPVAARVATQGAPDVASALAAVAAELDEGPMKPAQSGVARPAEQITALAPRPPATPPIERPAPRPYVLQPRPASFSAKPPQPGPIRPIAPPAAVEPATGPLAAPADKPIIPVVAPKAPEPVSSASATPPDIDTILNEIIARRERPGPAIGPRRIETPPAALAVVRPPVDGVNADASSPARTDSNADDQKAPDSDAVDASARDVDSPMARALDRETHDRDGETKPDQSDKPRLDQSSSTDEPVDDEMARIAAQALASEASIVVAPPIAQASDLSIKDDEKQSDDGDELAPPVATGDSADEKRDAVEPEVADQSTGEMIAEAPVKTLAPQAEKDGEPDKGATEIDAAASPSAEEPPPTEEQAADEGPATPQRKLVRSFSSGPNRYTMYDDGSIEADTPTGRLTFASFDDLRRYIDERMTTRGTGT